MTGKRGLWRVRSSLSGVGDGAVAGVGLRDAGCPEELTSPVSFPVPAGISKSVRGLWRPSPEPCRQSRYRAAPTIRGRPQWRSGAASFRARRGSAQRDELRDLACGRGDVGAWGEHRRRDGSSRGRPTSEADLDDDTGRRFSATSNARSNSACSAMSRFRSSSACAGPRAQDVAASSARSFRIWS
jgi:hypothetical protein